MLMTLAKFELLNLLRDKMTTVMIAYPLILGGIGKYLIVNNLIEGQVLGMIAMILTIMAGVAYGAMAGFSLLDDRDDQVFASIQISPVSLDLYIWFKVAFAYILAVLSGFFIIWYLAVFDLTNGQIMLLAASSALQTPILAFFINAFAFNKVEGFAAMKAAGFITMLPPVAAYFFLDWKEWLFALSPGYWTAKAVQYTMLQPQIQAGFISMNLSFYQYLIIGIVYNLILTALAFILFRKKNQIN